MSNENQLPGTQGPGGDVLDIPGFLRRQSNQDTPEQAPTLSQIVDLIQKMSEKRADMDKVINRLKEQAQKMISDL